MTLPSRETTFSFDETDEARNCLFAVPKKGRLFDKVSKILAGTGLDFVRPNRLDVAHCTSLPLTLVFLPAADIPAYVSEGNVDIGITGQDVVKEHGCDVEEILPLNFGACKLCVQAPVKNNVIDVSTLAGKRVVTSFPNLAKEFFDKFDTPENTTSIKYASGSVEAACALGLADAVVDLVETGTTMKAAGLEVVAEIMRTEAVLVSNKNCRHPEMVRTIKTRILGYMTATSFVMITYNVSKADLPKVLAITPGKRAPSVSPLLMDIEGNGNGHAKEEWMAVSALIKAKESSRIMDEIQSLGATDILIFEIQNSRM